MDDIHFEKDKHKVPFLMTCGGLEYLGTEQHVGIVYFKFYPKDLALKLIDLYDTKRVENPPQPKDLFEAFGVFLDKIHYFKDYGRMKEEYEGNRQI